MHILFIPAWWPTRHDPTAGVFIQKQAQAVAGLSHRVGVVFFQNLLFDPVVSEKSGLFMEETGGLKVFRQHGLWLLPKRNSWLLNRWATLHDRLFDDYCRKFGRPDLLHAQGFQSVFVAERLARRHGVPFVFTEQATVFRQKKVPGWLFPHLRWAWSAARAVVALTPALRDSMLEIWPDGKIEVVPNLILEEDWPPLPAPRSPRIDAPFTFITVVSLEPKKGLDILVTAFEKCCQRSAGPLRLVIVGDGPSRREVELLVKNSPFPNQIELAGVLTGKALREKLLAADGFALASRHETFCVAVVEAMACGLPVVATRSGGPEFILTEESGLLVEPGASAALAEAMLEMVAGRGGFSPEKIRASAMGRFSGKVVARRLEEIYRKAVG